MAKAKKQTEKDTIIVSKPKATVVVSVEKYNKLKADYNQLEDTYHKTVGMSVEALMQTAIAKSQVDKWKGLAEKGGEILELVQKELTARSEEIARLKKDLKTSYSFTQSLLNRGMED